MLPDSRVKIINPLSLQTSESKDDPAETFQQNFSSSTETYPGYNTVTPPGQSISSRGLLLDPLPLSTSVEPSPINTQRQSISSRGLPEGLLLDPIPLSTSVEPSSIDTQRLQFPSSALHLYTRLLQETASSGIDDESPVLLSKSSCLDDDEQGTTCSNSEVPLQSTNFADDYLPFSERPISTCMQMSAEDLIYQAKSSSSDDKLDELMPQQISHSSIEAAEKVIEPPIDIGSEENINDETGMVLDAKYDDAFQDTIENLPEVVENVSQAQRHQLVEVTKQKEVLQSMEDILAKEKDKLEETAAELNSCKRRICLAEDNGEQLKKQCKQLANDIKNTINEDFEIQKLQRQEEEMLKEKQRLYEQYRSKVSHHSQLVAEVEANIGVNVEVRKQQEIIAALQAQKTVLESKLQQGTSLSSRLQEDIKILFDEQNTLKGQIASYENKIEEECDLHTAINQDIEVLHKRNQAQMTRLKRQIKEGHLRIRQWNMEACQLERNLEELRKSMEE